MEAISRAWREVRPPSAPLSASRNDRVLEVAIYAGCASLLLAQIGLNFVDIDIWHQMALIRESIAAGHLLTHDVFAYTATVDPMIDHEWGAGILAFFFGKWIGGTGILLLKFTAAFGALFLTLRLARWRGATTTLLGFLAPLSIGLMAPGFMPTTRAQAYSFFLTACLLWVLETDRIGDHRWLWAWLAIFPFWVNVHAGFVVGLGFVFLYIVEQALLAKSVRPALFVLCGMALEIFLNPYGPRYLSYLARALTMARPRIPEWGPVWSLGWPMTFVFTASVGIFLYALVESRRWGIPGVLLLAASAIEALLHRKQLPFFAISWLCYAPAYVQTTAIGQWLQQFAQRRTRFLRFAWTVVIAVCLAPAIRLECWKVQVPQASGEASYPVGAVDYLAALKFHGNVMVPFRQGAYVSWKLYPAVKVSIDSRYEVAYPIDWAERTFRFYEAAEGWRETLAAYPTDLVLTRRNAPVRSLIRELGWSAVYSDAQFELCARPGLQLPIVDRSTESFTGIFP